MGNNHKLSPSQGWDGEPCLKLSIYFTQVNGRLYEVEFSYSKLAQDNLVDLTFLVGSGIYSYYIIE